MSEKGKIIPLRRHQSVCPIDVGVAVYIICVSKFHLYGDLYDAYIAWRNEYGKHDVDLAEAVLEALQTLARPQREV